MRHEYKVKHKHFSDKLKADVRSVNVGRSRKKAIDKDCNLLQTIENIVSPITNALPNETPCNRLVKVLENCSPGIGIRFQQMKEVRICIEMYCLNISLNWLRFFLRQKTLLYQ